MGTNKISSQPIPIEDRWMSDGDDLFDVNFPSNPRELGGPGSGFKGHKGRKGKRGGSAPDDIPNQDEAVPGSWSGLHDFLFGHFPPEQVRAIEQAVVECRNWGVKYARENAIIMGLDPDGKMSVLLRKQGEEYSVGVTPEDMVNADFLIHNHPSSKAFSVQDMATFLASGKEKMMVVGNNGNMFLLERTEGTPIPPLTSETERLWYSTAQSYFRDLDRGMIRASQSQFHRIWNDPDFLADGSPEEVAIGLAWSKYALPWGAEEAKLRYSAWLTDDWQERSKRYEQ